MSDVRPTKLFKCQFCGWPQWVKKEDVMEWIECGSCRFRREFGWTGGTNTTKGGKG